MITEVLARGGESDSGRKAYVQAVHNISSEYKRLKISKKIVFSDEYLRGVKTLCDDIIVILAIIVNFEVQKILITSRSVTNVLLYYTFERMMLSREKFIALQCPLCKFNGEAIILGVINLLMILGIESKYLYNLIIDFLRIKVPLIYNVILGCPCMQIFPLFII